jgi:hypothetical protein
MIPALKADTSVVDCIRDSLRSWQLPCQQTGHDAKNFIRNMVLQKSRCREKCWSLKSVSSPGGGTKAVVIGPKAVKVTVNVEDRLSQKFQDRPEGRQLMSAASMQSE